MHRLRHEELADRAAQHGTAVAAARKGSGARALELKLPPPARLAAAALAATRRPELGGDFLTPAVADTGRAAGAALAAGHDELAERQCTAVAIGVALA